MPPHAARETIIILEADRYLHGKAPAPAYFGASNDDGNPLKKILSGVGPRYPQVGVLVGATGDLSRRKLLPGLFHLSTAGFIPSCRIGGVSLDDRIAESFRAFARDALDQFSSRLVREADWAAFADVLDCVPLAAAPDVLMVAVKRGERALGRESRRLHYLSVPPSPTLSAVRMLGTRLLGSASIPRSTRRLGRIATWW